MVVEEGHKSQAAWNVLTHISVKDSLRCYFTSRLIQVRFACTLPPLLLFFYFYFSIVSLPTGIQGRRTFFT